MSMNQAHHQVPPDVLARVLSDPDLLEDVIEQHEGIDIGKAWNGLQYLVGPALAESGEPIGMDFAGYGPALGLTVEEVKEIAERLTTTSEDDLREAFDPSDMRDEGIYPGDWDSPDDLDWLVGAFRELRAYYQDAAAKGNAMVTYLT